MKKFELTFVHDDADSDRFKNFLKSTPPMTEDSITNITIAVGVPTWIFYPPESDPGLRNGKIEQDDVTVLTFHEGEFESEDEEYDDCETGPFAEGTYDGKVGYWVLEMRGNLLPDFVEDTNCWH